MGTYSWPGCLTTRLGNELSVRGLDTTPGNGTSNRRGTNRAAYYCVLHCSTSGIARLHGGEYETWTGLGGNGSLQEFDVNSLDRNQTLLPMQTRMDNIRTYLTKVG
jgi:hypothetical protein